MPVVDLARDGAIATITVDNPPENRLTRDVMLGFASAIQDLSTSSGTRALVIRSKGPDFSLGGDITPWLGMAGSEFEATISAGLAVSNALEDLPIPVIASVQGRCHGGGFEVALRADIIVAAEDASFRHSEATIGVFTFLGGVQRVAERVGRTRATEWAFTAEEIPAPEALRTGLVNEVVASGELAGATDAWARRLAGGATLAHAAHKQLLRVWSDSGVRAADERIPKLAASIIESADVQGSLPGAIEALRAGKPRPAHPFEGR